MLEYDMALVIIYLRVCTFTILQGNKGRLLQHRACRSVCTFTILQGYKGLYASLLFYKSTKASSVLRLPSIVYFISSILKSS